MPKIINYPVKPICEFQKIRLGEFFMVELGNNGTELFLKIDPIDTDRHVWNAIDCSGLPESFDDTDVVIPIDVEINITYKRD